MRPMRASTERIATCALAVSVVCVIISCARCVGIGSAPTARPEPCFWVISTRRGRCASCVKPCTSLSTRQKKPSRDSCDAPCFLNKPALKVFDQQTLAKCTSLQRLAHVSILVGLNHVALLEVLLIIPQRHLHRIARDLNTALLSLVNLLYFVLKVTNRRKTRSLENHLMLTPFRRSSPRCFAQSDTAPVASSFPNSPRIPQSMTICRFPQKSTLQHTPQHPPASR